MRIHSWIRTSKLISNTNVQPPVVACMGRPLLV